MEHVGDDELVCVRDACYIEDEAPPDSVFLSAVWTLLSSSACDKSDPPPSFFEYSL